MSKEWKVFKTFSSYEECKCFVKNAGSDSVSLHKRYKSINNNCKYHFFQCVQHEACGHQYRISSSSELSWCIKESGQHSTVLIEDSKLCPSGPIFSFNQDHSTRIKLCLLDGLTNPKQIAKRLTATNCGGLTIKQIKNFKTRHHHISQHVNFPGVYFSRYMFMYTYIVS